ncbi:hypothetical protein GGF40_001487 [Coemansia sp. RSA 1286]|nr:hypothetical protein IWW45_001230 [Coemansia sp. RSA 485]KAJ2638643.1 hypothetical protein GGF40_001487 [Coemansia sp. RSA 1286]
MDINIRLWSLLLLQLLFQLSGSSAIALNKRVSSSDPLSPDNYRGAVLVVNGSQTSCEFAVINNSYSFIAANCVADSSGKVDTTKVYQIYFNDADNQAPVKATISSSQIHIHPSYNPSTFANNIAVVSYTGVPDGWRSSIAISPSEWKGRDFIRRYMTNVNSMSWSSPIIETLQHPSTQCAIYSGLYAANLDNMFCTTSNLPAMFGAQCSIPYSMAFAFTEDQIAPAALYSHAIYFGNSLCDDSGKKRIYFYTLLQNYIAFAESITGYQLYVLPDHHDRGYNMDPNFKLNEPLFGPVAGAKVYEKNLFTDVNTDEVVEPAETNNSNGNSNSNGSSSSNSGNNSSDGNGNGNSSNNSNNSNNSGNSGSNSNSSSSNVSSANGGSNPDSNSNSGNSNQADNDSVNPTTTSNNGSNSGNSDSSNNSNSNDNNNQASDNEDVTDADGDGFADDIFVAEGETFSDTGLHTLTQTISGRPTVMVVTATRVAVTGVHATSGPNSSDTKNAAASEESGEGGNGKKIGIAVSMTILALILIIGGIYGARWYRKRKIDNRWSRSVVHQMVESQTVENEIGVSDQARYDLPDYGNHQRTQFVAAGANTPRSPF